MHWHNFVDGKEKSESAEHPLFGKMTIDEKGWGMYKHLDPHLTQFGVKTLTNQKSRHSREGGNPLQINNLVQVLDARLLRHDNIEVFCLKWKIMN